MSDATRIFAQPKAPPLVEVEFTDRGVIRGADYFAARAVQQIEIGADQNNWPDHIKAQMRQRRKMLREIIHYNIERAINSDRYLLEIKLRAMGHTDAADFLKTERVVK